MAVRSIKSKKFPHVEFLDLQNNGILVECAILKRDAAGNLIFVQLNELDMIDRRRLAKILTNRNANNFALWDLMAQSTLGNGMNALAYFHQIARQITPSGQIVKPGTGFVGAPVQAAPAPESAE